MKIVVFLGPSLPLDEARGLLDAQFLGPASHGDVYRAATRNQRPDTIALIDGRFESVPAVRHREILWALKNGISVVGAASIGALRACELRAFGMSGFGKIYEAYCAGLIDGDDEVALAHGPEEAAYLPLSVPLVNVRASLSRAREEGVIDAESESKLLSFAKRIFYKDRTYDRLLAEAADRRLAVPNLGKLATWLRTRAIDQKRQDAHGLLEALSTEPAAVAFPPTDFHMHYVDIWELDVGSMEAVAQYDDNAEPLPLRAILDELGLVPETYQRVRAEALRIALIRREAHRTLNSRDARRSHEAEKLLRKMLKIPDSRSMRRWMVDNDLDQSGYLDMTRVVGETAHMQSSIARLIDLQMVTALRLDGSYVEFARRAQQKLECLGAEGSADYSTTVERPPDFQLAHWYFDEILGRPVPENLDEFAREQGFSDVTTFVRALKREYQFMVWRKAHDGVE